MRGETYEEVNFGDGFAGYDFRAGLAGAGYSALPEDALYVTMGGGDQLRYCVKLRLTPSMNA